MYRSHLVNWLELARNAPKVLKNGPNSSITFRCILFYSGVSGQWNSVFEVFIWIFFFRLPSTLFVTWPEGYEITQNESRCAGETVGTYKLLCFVTENDESHVFLLFAHFIKHKILSNLPLWSPWIKAVTCLIFFKLFYVAIHYKL